MGILNNTVSETQIKLKDRIWLYFIALLILFLLVVPSLVVIPMSFSEASLLNKSSSHTNELNSSLVEILNIDCQKMTLE